MLDSCLIPGTPGRLGLLLDDELYLEPGAIMPRLAPPGRVGGPGN